jgi:small subunit ribosomal protein S2e
LINFAVESPFQLFDPQSNMADAPRGGARGGFGSRGDRGGERGRGRGRRGRRGPKSEEKEWQPVTKLGRLVKAGKITSMEQIYLHSLPIKEFQIVDWFLPKLKDEVMKVSILYILCQPSHRTFRPGVEMKKAKPQI